MVDRLRIFWPTVDRSIRIDQLYEPLQRCIAARPDCEVVPLVRPPLSMEQIDHRDMRPLLDLDLANSCDVVYCDAPWGFVTDPWGELRVPVVAMFGDLHGALVRDYMGYWLDECQVRHVANWFRDAFLTIHPERARRLATSLWLPQSIDPEVFRDLLPWGHRTVSIQVTGSVSTTTYAFRYFAAEALEGVPGYRRVRKPPSIGSGWPHGTDYARVLSDAKMGLQSSPEHDGQSLQYPTSKTYEVPACGSVLVTTWENELADLGFVHERNCLVVDRDNLVGTVRRWLADDDALRALAIAGRELVHARHTTAARAETLVAYLRGLV